jgi:nitrate/nitrite-specific signal transduction histidine kinase
VRFSITNGSFVVTVLDKGKGFDTSLLNSFDPKAGFGLLTIKERANYIGGNLLIESEVGQGSCFTLTVPIIKHKPDDLIQATQVLTTLQQVRILPRRACACCSLMIIR